MHWGVWRKAVYQIRSNVRTTTTKTATVNIQLNVFKQCQTDVRCELHNRCLSSAHQLAQVSMHEQLCKHTYTQAKPTATSNRTLTLQSSSTANYSRYSASTIMNSYCKELAMKDYDIVGFDLDGTLLRYHLHEMTTLIYNVLKQYLVEKKGYPTALLDKELDMDFLQKGLMLDGPRGNVLKLSNEATILRASHGTRLLSDEEVVAAYGEGRQWDVATAFFNDPLSTWNGPAAKEMRTLLDYFDMPSALVFAQAVDIVDQGSSPKAYSVWLDLQDALMHIYSRDNFGNDKSLYFKAMRAEPQRYVLTQNHRLVSWLQELRDTGKKLFLLTGSNIDFANLTATQALGPGWQQHFDFIVTYAKKPGFFTLQRPFLSVDLMAQRELPETELSLQAELKSGEIYSQGNWRQLHQSMAKLLNKETGDARALYFGDNIIQDVYTPVKHRDFDTVAIAEELFLLEQADYPFKAVLASKFWDSYFTCNKTPTLWSGFIANYAQICVSSMEQMMHTSPTERVVCTNVNGFYPALPKQLECSNLTTCWHGGRV